MSSESTDELPGRNSPRPSQLDRAIARRPADPLTRRAFLVRAAALGISATALGALLEACDEAASTRAPSRSPSISPGAAFGGTPPTINPTPTSATYGDMLEATELVALALPGASFSTLLDEVAADARVPVATTVSGGRRQARLSVRVDDPSLRSQAYRLEVVAADDGPGVTIQAGDEAGAYYGLVSLGQLLVADGATTWLRAATVDDAPGFVRRGAILDPAPLTGVSTEESRALLLDQVRFGVRHKLNFVDLPDRTPWPELVRYCDSHHVELMVGKGYRDRLTVTLRQQVKDELTALLNIGVRSISLAWDDIPATNPEALAREHAEIFRDLYDHLRGREPGIRVSAVLPPYGGIPGRNLVASAEGSGERYLAVMRDALPDDVRVFWTGDGGVFSARVTTGGAKAYAAAVGHEIGLWDNDARRFAQGRLPCSGRAADLATAVSAYMGNLVGVALWKGTNGEFALLTTLFYAWNPSAYDPSAAAASAERMLATTSATAG